MALPILSHSTSANVVSASAVNHKAPPITSSDAAPANIAGPALPSAIAATTKPASTTPPFSIALQSISPNFSSATAVIKRAAPSASRVLCAPLSSINLVAITKPPITIRPLAKSVQETSANSCIAFDVIHSAAARPSKPLAVSPSALIPPDKPLNKPPCPPPPPDASAGLTASGRLPPPPVLSAIIFRSLV